MDDSFKLEVRDLRLTLNQTGVNANVQNAMDVLKGINFSLSPGSSLAILGRTASGKSLLLRSLTRLLHDVPYREVSGEVNFDGMNLLKTPENRLRRIRGSRIATLLQYSEFNRQLSIAQHLHLLLRANAPQIRDRLRHVINYLYRVGLVDPEDIVLQRVFPDELDRAVLQKVSIATALACEPELLILDEPVTEVDSRSRERIVRTLEELKKERGMSIITATGNLRLAGQFGDVVAVLNGGVLVESNTPRLLFDAPVHPATRAFVDGTLRAGHERHRLIAHFYREP